MTKLMDAAFPNYDCWEMLDRDPMTSVPNVNFILILLPSTAHVAVGSKLIVVMRLRRILMMFLAHPKPYKYVKTTTSA